MARPRRLPDERATADRILDAAEALAQVRGFNGFSYADISGEVGVTTASLHYHYRTKADLGRSLVARYHATFAAALADLYEAIPGAIARLEGYVTLYTRVLRGDRMCLCGMLAAEFSTLPGPVQESIRAFFEMNEEWLAGVLEEGRVRGEIAFEGAARETAAFFVSALEGAMLLARSYGDISRFEAAARRLIADLKPSA